MRSFEVALTGRLAPYDLEVLFLQRSRNPNGDHLIVGTVRASCVGTFNEIIVTKPGEGWSKLLLERLTVQVVMRFRGKLGLVT